MNFTVWHQYENYEVDELGELDKAQAIEVIQTVDWSQHFENYGNHEKASASDTDKDICPGGIGVNSSEGDIFHLSVLGDNKWLLMLELKNTSKFLGLFPKPKHSKSITIHSLNTAVKLLKMFYAGERDALLHECLNHE